MKKATYILFFLILLLIIKSCIEPIIIKDLDNESFLVVEATLTDELKIQTVKLSRTYALDSSKITQEKNAIVTIKSNATTYNFTETSDGNYTSNIAFKALANNIYTLNIKTSNGVIYNSEPEKLIGKSVIEELIVKQETNNLNEEGLKIYLKGKGLDESSKYFRYEYEETYKIIAPFWSESKLEILSDVYSFAVQLIHNLDNNKVCYKTEKSTDIILKETATLENGAINSEIRFINKNNFSISHRYSILVKQYVHSFEAYNYYKTLSKLTTNENSFTQTQPGFLLGNISPTNSTNKKAIGFFEVVTVVSKRLFLDRVDYYPNESVEYVDECKFTAPLLVVFPHADPIIFAFSPLVRRLKQKEYIFYKLNPTLTESLPGDYLLVPKVCGDCREIGTNIKPSFWID